MVRFGYFGRFEGKKRNQTENFRFSNYQNQNQTKPLRNRNIQFGRFGSAGLDQFRIIMLKPSTMYLIYIHIHIFSIHESIFFRLMLLIVSFFIFNHSCVYIYVQLILVLLYLNKKIFLVTYVKIKFFPDVNLINLLVHNSLHFLSCPCITQSSNFINHHDLCK